jgi:hypothetical protein
MSGVRIGYLNVHGIVAVWSLTASISSREWYPTSILSAALHDIRTLCLGPSTGASDGWSHSSSVARLSLSWPFLNSAGRFPFWGFLPIHCN